MKNKLSLSLIILLTLSLLPSCKSDSPEEPNYNGGGTGDLQPAPNPEPTPIPDDPTPTPKLETWSIPGDDFSKDDKKDNPIPYRTWFVKTVRLNQNVESKKCVEGFEDRCVVNRQVLFQFLTEDVQEKYPAEFWELTSAKLTASYYSIKKNNGNELLCLLNSHFCSGEGIVKNWAGKLIWWSLKFWTKKYDQIVRNEWFKNFIMEGYDEERGLYIRRDETINLLDIYPVRIKDMERYIRKDHAIRFALTNDTYIEDPVLELQFRERERYGDTHASP